ALVLTVCIFTLLFTLPAGADGEVFVAAGNTVLPLTDAMPIRSSGVWYIDYQCFTKGNLNVNSSYNAAERMLVLYTWDTTLIFDLNKTVAYTATEKIPYKAVSFAASGTVYVPVQFTSQMLGFEYTYFSDLPMIRIKRSSDIPNNMFTYIAQNEIPDLLAAYNASKEQENSGSVVSPPPSDTQPEKDDPDDGTERKNIRLTFDITNGKNMKSILDALSRYGYRATFFVQGSAFPACENELRRAVCAGHSIGTLSQNGSSDFSADAESLTSALDLSNKNLFEITKTKTRLLRVPGGSKSLSDSTVNHIISLGYRIWDEHITPQGSTSSRVYSSAISRLESTSSTVPVLSLSDSDVSVNALTRILRYLNTNKYRTYTISVLDKPVNDISEKR
ncbi:MAG: polysaccharide deacetylase family protein, partial [Oscillospiraceae bacterium]|nr:polysaccharide deacetylase family protein [Oscillospiraceae bacterium]